VSLVCTVFDHCYLYELLGGVQWCVVVSGFLTSCVHLMLYYSTNNKYHCQHL
jgi:hypothetical protein